MSKQDNYIFFERYKRTKPFNMLSAHFHASNELYYLIKGTTKYFINNEIFILHAGDMIFVPQNELHKTASDSINERILFSFDEEVLGEKFKPYISEMAADKLITLNSDGIQKVNELILKMEKEYSEEEPGYKEMLFLYFQQLLIIISRHKRKGEKKLNPTFLLMQDVSKYISDNLNTDLSLNVLANTFSLSTSHLSKSFKTATGIGLNEYINIMRVKRAEKLLLETDMPITRIATECGYNDSNYFSSVFKRMIGITPKRYSVINKTDPTSGNDPKRS